MKTGRAWREGLAILLAMAALTYVMLGDWPARWR